MARGVSPEALDDVRSPAGLNIGAEAPEEVAPSVLAEIVQERRAALRWPRAPPGSVLRSDPIWDDGGVAGAAHKASPGQTYYFAAADVAGDSDSPAADRGGRIRSRQEAFAVAPWLVV